MANNGIRPRVARDNPRTSALRLRYHGYGCLTMGCHCDVVQAIHAKRLARLSSHPEPLPPKPHGPSRWYRDTDTWPGKP